MKKMLLCLKEIKWKNFIAIFYIVYFLTIFSTLILCWHWELGKSFWTLNAVQVVYNFIVVGMNEKHNNITINGRKAIVILCIEMLLIATLLFIAGSTKSDNGGKVTLEVLFLLIALSAGLIYFLFRSNLNPFTFWCANMYGLAATLVVYRSNQYMLSMTYEQSMQQWIQSCLITYSISLIFFIGSKTVCKLRKMQLDNRV